MGEAELHVADRGTGFVGENPREDLHIVHVHATHEGLDFGLDGPIFAALVARVHRPSLHHTLKGVAQVYTFGDAANISSFAYDASPPTAPPPHFDQAPPTHPLSLP